MRYRTSFSALLGVGVFPALPLPPPPPPLSAESLRSMLPDVELGNRNGANVTGGVGVGVPLQNKKAYAC